MSRWALALALLLSCDGSGTEEREQTPDEIRIVSALEAGWAEARWHDDPLPPLGDCLEGASIEWAASPQEFIQICGGDVEHNASCVTQRKVQRGLLVHAYAVAVMAPGLPVYDFTGSAALHEFLHWSSGCVFRTRDAAHRDPRLWTAAGHEASVQSIAREILRESAP